MDSFDGRGCAAAPEVKVQPQGQTIAAGGWVLLSVGAVGTSPLKYQWQKEGVAINGATNVFLQVRVLGANQAGNYRVVVTNSAGSVTSAVAKVDWVARAYVTGWGAEVFFPLTGAKPIALAAGPSHSLALRSDGTVTAWGNSFYRHCMVPPELRDAIAVSAGDRHSLALSSDGSMTAWGSFPQDPNYYGQSVVPAGIGAVKAIALGPYHNLVLRADGTVFAWGISNSVTAGLSGVTAIAAGGTGYRNLALRDNGTVVAWVSRLMFQQGYPMQGASPWETGIISRC